MKFKNWPKVRNFKNKLQEKTTFFNVQLTMYN